MDYLIKLLGDYSIGWAITVIAALVFLGLCYRKVEKYFSDKAIHEKEKNEQFKKVMDQVNMYPTWHQQSLEIQQQFNTSIAELKEGMEKQQEKLDKIEKENTSRERSKLRDRLLQSHRYFTNQTRTPCRHGAKWRQTHFGPCLKSMRTPTATGTCTRLYNLK